MKNELHTKIHIVGQINKQSVIQKLEPKELPYQSAIYNALEEAQTWVLSLASPHPDLGRRGAVCPVVPKAIRKKSLYMVHHWCGENTALDSISQALVAYETPFRELERSLDPQKGEYCSLLFVFVGNSSEHLIFLLEEAQAQLQLFFAQHGLMLGKFFLECSMPGIHNPSFKPFQTPVPMLGIRRLMPQDLIFSMGRPDFMSTYMQYFGISDKNSLEEFLKAAKLEQAPLFLQCADKLMA